MHTKLFCEWRTVETAGLLANSTIVQEEAEWLDATAARSAFFWLDCRYATNGVQLGIDTAPCRSEDFWAPLVQPVTLVAAQAPVLLYAGIPGVSILGGLLRWRLFFPNMGAAAATIRLWAGLACA